MDPFPLNWPKAQPRTPTAQRERSRFRTTVLEAVLDLKRELELMGASKVVITSDLPTRQDGLPYSSGSCHDPGIAVYFVHGGYERVISCDRWDRPAANLRAIGLTVQSLRGIERWGTAAMVTQAFAGFAALPAGEPQKRPWREVFTVTRTITKRSPRSERIDVLQLVAARHRDLIRQLHPDSGGSDAAAAEINAARDEAERELAG